MVKQSSCGKSTKIISLIVCFFFLLEQIGFAQVASQLDISSHLAGLRNSFTQEVFRPLHLRYLSYNNINDNFELLLDKGEQFKEISSQEKTEEEANKLMAYFLVGVSLPNESFWVNLRPDAENNIIDSELAKTDMGKVLLEADLQLKKDTAQFTSPQTTEGRAYWDKLYKKAQELFGYENITIPTLTRPWIVPAEIVIGETKDNAYIYKANLKVMLEEDYLKNSRHLDISAQQYDFKDPRLKELNKYSTELMKELIIPKITREVNTSKRYAALRQVYYSLIMAQWFKQKFHGKEGTYSHFIDKQELTGLTSKQNWSKTTYFNEYQESFKQGEYNLKEPVRTPFGQTIRTYFSGGVSINVGSPLTQVADKLPQPGQIGVIATPQTKILFLETNSNPQKFFSPALLRVIARTKEEGVLPELNLASQKADNKVSSALRIKAKKTNAKKKEQQLQLEEMRAKAEVIRKLLEDMAGDEDFSGASFSTADIARKLGVSEEAVKDAIKGTTSQVKDKLWKLIDPRGKFKDIQEKKISSSIELGNRYVRQAELAAMGAVDEEGVRTALGRYDDAIAEYRQDTTAEGIKLLERAVKKQKRLKKSLGDLKEEFDVIGADGKPTGERVTRFKAHKEGIAHNNANLMLLKRGKDGVLYFLGQKRESTKDIFPSKISNGAAGHVKAGQSAVDALVRECAEEVSSGEKKLELNPEDVTLIGKEGEHLGVLEMYEYSFFNDGEKEKLLGVLKPALAGQTEEPVDQIFYEVNEELGVIYLFTYNKAQHKKIEEIANKVVTDTKIVYGNYTNNVEAKTLGVVLLKEGSPQLQLVNEIVEEVNQKGIGGGGEVAGFMWLNFIRVREDFKTHPEQYTDAFAPFLNDVRIGGEILQALGFSSVNFIPQEQPIGGRIQRREITGDKPEGPVSSDIVMDDGGASYPLYLVGKIAERYIEIVTGNNSSRRDDPLITEFTEKLKVTKEQVTEALNLPAAEAVKEGLWYLVDPKNQHSEAKATLEQIVSAYKTSSVSGGEDGVLYPGDNVPWVVPVIDGGAKLISPIFMRGKNEPPNTSSGILDEEVGGIDFTALNVINNPVILNPVSILGTNAFRNIFSPKNILRGEALNSELTSLEDMVNKGVTPSLERIKQCVSSCCAEQQSEQAIERLSVCISGVLRMEEEYQRTTDPLLLAMLSLLQLS